MNSPSPATLSLLAILPLLIWRSYSRFRRMVGRQQLSKYRPWITLVIFPLFIVLLGVATWAHQERLWLLATGLAFGAGLGVFGLKKTLFEPTAQGFFYTPNAHLGIALSLLFIGRILYRMVEVYGIDPTSPHEMDNFARSPLTLAIFGLLAGYYMSYAFGLLRWRFGAQKTANENSSM
jgi:hypothetical protein